MLAVQCLTLQREPSVSGIVLQFNFILTTHAFDASPMCDCYLERLLHREKSVCGTCSLVQRSDHTTSSSLPQGYQVLTPLREGVSLH